MHCNSTRSSPSGGSQGAAEAARPARSRRMHGPWRTLHARAAALRKPVASVRALSGLPMHDQDSLAQALFSAWFSIARRLSNSSAREGNGIRVDMQNNGRMPCRDNGVYIVLGCCDGACSFGASSRLSAGADLCQYQPPSTDAGALAPLASADLTPPTVRPRVGSSQSRALGPAAARFTRLPTLRPSRRAKPPTRRTALAATTAALSRRGGSGGAVVAPRTLCRVRRASCTGTRSRCTPGSGPLRSWDAPSLYKNGIGDHANVHNQP
jgi:hypothetical protein